MTQKDPDELVHFTASGPKERKPARPCFSNHSPPWGLGECGIQAPAKTFSVGPHLWPKGIGIVVHTPLQRIKKRYPNFIIKIITRCNYGLSILPHRSLFIAGKILRKRNNNKKGAKAGEKKTKKTETRSIKEIMEEQARIDEACPHVDEPRRPGLLYGVPPMEVLPLAEEWADQAKRCQGLQS